MNSPIVKDKVDKYINDYYLNMKTIELGESKYQELTIKGLMNKSKKIEKDIDLLISTDLQNQNLSSSLSAMKFKIPFLGIYSACAGFTEGLILGSSLISKNDNNIIVTTSSHNLVSEKQFRYPVEYGAIRKKVNTCTSTGSVSVLLSKNKSNIKIESSTIGSVYGIFNDTNNMGAAMAYSACETIKKHIDDTHRSEDYYDLILTGDLGVYGTKILKECYKKKYEIKLENIIDSGSIYYNNKDVYAGASGPLCLPLILFDYILPLRRYKKILIVGTGSLHSVVSSNLQLNIPNISHAVSLEVSY